MTAHLSQLCWLDLWTAAMAGISSVFLGLRSQILRPSVHIFPTAPVGAWLSMSALSVTLSIVAASIILRGGATAREAMFFTILAPTTAIMFYNLIRYKGGVGFA